MIHQRRPFTPKLLAGCFVIMSWAVILFGPSGDVNSAAADQNHHHLPVIRLFASQLPWPDIRDYESATAPLWHIALAIPARLGASDVLLRLLTALSGGILVLVVAMGARRFSLGQATALMALPLALNPYVLYSSMWITTDVPALTVVALAMLSCYASRRWSGIPLAIAVAIRQTSVWALPALAVLSAQRSRERGGTAKAVLLSQALALLPAVVMLGLLAFQWQGLMPPRYRNIHDRGLSLATPAFSLAMVAVWGVPLLACAWSELARLSRAAVVAAGAVGLTLALSVPTSVNFDAGRWSGPIWTIADQLPVILERSLLITVLAPIGAISLLMLVSRAIQAGQGLAGVTLGLGVIGMIAVNSVNTQCWERYADPPLLLLLPWLASAGIPGSSIRSRTQLVRGVVILSIAQLLMSATMIAVPIARGVVIPQN